MPLASIAHQTRTPDYLVIVDDSSPTCRPANQRVAADLRCPGTRVVYLENRRTPGLSGAVKQALAWLQAEAPSSLVAMLDDDDAWEATYLERCKGALNENDLDMVAAGIVYHETGGKLRHLNSPPHLDVDELLVRNPHIQGSNLLYGWRNCWRRVVSMRLWSAPPIATSASGWPTWALSINGNIPDYLVHHHAEDDRPRLSSRGGECQMRGIAVLLSQIRGSHDGWPEGRFPTPQSRPFRPVTRLRR